MSPTRSRHHPTSLDVAIARILDSAMAGKRPRVTRADLSRLTGIDASMVSRMLKPEKPMLVDELVAVCEVLGLDAGRVIDEARRRVAERIDGAERPAPHSTTVTPEDIAAGATLPPGVPQHRRSVPSSGTRRRRNTH